ncbi:uncharacterized protein [Amphiura filiformis]|uniref:uncharacterized protein n=1 Tax=Amphiura filiformis TaxID=82378 RepID=UPI003B2166CB
MATAEAVDPMEEAEAVGPDERSILVENIPYETDDVGQLKDHLQKHFENSSNGGGNVDKIICPVRGNISTAIVVFMSGIDAKSTVKHGKHEFADEDVEVSLLPLVFQSLTVTLEKLYWDIMIRKQSKEISGKIADYLGKENIEESKTHRITKARCTLRQAHELQDMVLAAGPLGSQQVETDIFDRSIYIADIPYVTDDKEQLEKELETYLQRVTGNKLDRLICGIQGDMTKAIAVFHTTEAVGSFLEIQNKRDTDARFLDEELSVSKLPPLFTNVTATCDDFYFKMIPKKAKDELQSAMEERGGSGLTIRKNIISGSFHQVCEGRNVIMEIAGIASQEGKTCVALRSRASELKQDLTKEKESEKANAAPNHTESDKSDAPDQVPSHSNIPKSKLALKNNHRDQDKASPKPTEETTNPDEKRGIKKYPGRAQQRDQITRQGSKGDDDGGQNIEQKLAKRQEKEFQKSFEQNKDKHGDKNEPSGTTTSHKSEKTKKQPQFDDELPKREERDNLVKLDVKHPPTEDNSNDSVLDEQKLISTTATPIDAKKEQSQPTANDHDDSRGESSGGLATTSSSQEVPDGCAEVDEVIFEYVTTIRTEDYEAIEAKHDVSITAKQKTSLRPRTLVVEVKSRKKTKRKHGKGDATLEAKKDFIKLYSETMSDVICKSLDCSGVSTQKLQKAIKMICSKFKNILLHKESEIVYIFCGKEETVKDGMDEFRITACMNEENQPLSVDKIAFQYLKQKTTELDALGRKYNVYFDLKDSSSNTPEQQEVYIKPLHSGKQKKKR